MKPYLCSERLLPLAELSLGFLGQQARAYPTELLECLHLTEKDDFQFFAEFQIRESIENDSEIIFSSPGRSPGRAVILPPASALAKCLSFYVKVFYMMGKVLSGELSCPCDRSCFLYF